MIIFLSRRAVDRSRVGHFLSHPRAREGGATNNPAWRDLHDHQMGRRRSTARSAVVCRSGGARFANPPARLIERGEVLVSAVARRRC